MRHPLAIPLGLTLAALSLQASAGIFSDAIPPARFREETSAQIQTIEPVAISDVCAQLMRRPPPGGMAYLACVQDGRIYIPNPCAFPDDRYAQTLCHELGHVQGWPREHPIDPDEAGLSQLPNLQPSR